ncbi:NAD-dependent succinate-semialdehyde dehydrogenase [Cryobacterium zhongshanensis]|uniref:NAD-dependent succinate-semialdehyde dehydrogenase n=1 Tax=Cryobacterium zhongshanensis TaxID=2928153 RepID=A0AA41UHL7_9MICO|nr:NAD-dependent succinate-semialdehyde dehydrogenase [Cryobacterium zhongshanensis]MCI4658569.1 NAD-dependent succinate-semialdehyde dehydrogenase [Cryobacterium zhongshanensis]
MSLYAVTNPATGELVKDYPTATGEAVEAALSSVAAASLTWRCAPIDDRVRLLRRVAELYTARRDQLAAIITREMGKPISQAGLEVDIAVSIYNYYADNGPGFLADEELDVVAGGTAVVRKEGLGALLGIMPWNYPYYQVARFAAPNLMNGNSILLKHAPQCPESALAMEQIFRDAGAPEGAYVNIFATTEQVAVIIADDRIQGVSLTGSEGAGAAVAEIAGRHLKKVVLELGGSDPYLVLDSADPEYAARQAVLGRFGNAGQACNAAKRFIVEQGVYEEFLKYFTTAVSAISVGDPSDPRTFMGPLSSVAAVNGLADQVDDAISKGATAVLGGARLDGPGAWYPPTVLVGVTPDMRAYSEELFGPVAVVHRVDSEDEAIAMANASTYGLGAAIQSADPVQAERIARRLQAGMVTVNEASGTAAELPFGGVKRSGIGRELGRYGMDEFVNRKLIRVAPPRPDSAGTAG